MPCPARAPASASASVSASLSPLISARVNFAPFLGETLGISRRRTCLSLFFIHIFYTRVYCHGHCQSA